MFAQNIAANEVRRVSIAWRYDYIRLVEHFFEFRISELHKCVNFFFRSFEVFNAECEHGNSFNAEFKAPFKGLSKLS
jgi:hypothetical protein